MDDDGSSFEFEAGWTAHARHVANARAFVTVCLEDQGLVGSTDDVRLVVSELATNAVVHASTPFTVNLSRLDGVLTLAVADGSSVQPQQLEGPLALYSHGRGLDIVESLSTSWGVSYSIHGKSVWATFDALGVKGPATSPKAL